MCDALVILKKISMYEGNLGVLESGRRLSKKPPLVENDIVHVPVGCDVPVGGCDVPVGWDERDRGGLIF